jgi:putative transposase
MRGFGKGKAAGPKSGTCATIAGMSRLRRLFVTGKIFFLTCNVLRTQTPLSDDELEILARVFDAVRKRRRFLLGGYVFMPDHWHALLVPREGETLPRLMGALKVASTQAVNRSRSKRGDFWQPRYYDHAIRTVKEFHDALRYMHLNPVQKKLVKRPEQWRWSSFHSYGGPGPVGLAVDDLNLPADEATHL